MKPASATSVPGHHRCLYLSATGRKCRTWVLDPRGMFCPRHTQAQPHGPDDFSLQLLHRSCNFQNAEGIHDSLRHLYILLAAGAISPRRAAVLGYLTSLLLRTLPAVHNDPLPAAGTPMSAAQLAEHEKANFLAAPPSKPPAPVLTQKPTRARKTLPTQQAALAQESVPTRTPVLTDKAVPPNKIVRPHSAQPTSQRSTDPAPPTTGVAAHALTGDHLSNGASRPMPATRAEFAAQVLKSLASAPTHANPAVPSSTKPNPLAISPTATSTTDKELKPPLEPPSSKPINKTPTEAKTEATTATINPHPGEPPNQPTNKKPYQVRLHTNMHITGSEPSWGWTTDP